MYNHTVTLANNSPLLPFVEQIHFCAHQKSSITVPLATRQSPAIEPTNRIVEIEPPFDVYHEIKAGIKSPDVIFDLFMTYLLSDEL
jgi:hypothetical protein